MNRLVLALALVVIMASAAEAHRFRHPKTLRLGVTATKLLLEIRWDAQPGKDSERTRQLFDRNTDGRLDEAETALAVDAFERRQRTWLKTLGPDDKPITWRRVEAKPIGFERKTDSASLGVRLLYEAALPQADAFKLTVIDRSQNAQDHIPLRVEAVAPFRILKASQGERRKAGHALINVALDTKRRLVVHFGRNLEVDPSP